MVREINRDVEFLKLKSVDATQADLNIGQDLRDTLISHRGFCLGLAANMIGKNKRIIVAEIHDKPVVMYNPVILEKSGEYEAQEACLSIQGYHDAVRYKNILISYRDEQWRTQVMPFSGLEAQTIQHEMDHLEGILI